jgi:phosphoribosyl 1,2-cyclic phosphodiesterase
MTLFSGSRGNCALLTTNNTKILIDCGVGYRALTKALRSVNVSPKQINALFITHSHSDHISGLFNFVKYNAAAEVFVHKEGFDELYGKTYWKASTFEENFTYRDIAVSFYRCSHDASCCVGYSFKAEGKLICYVTDTGCVNEKLVDFIKGCDSLVIESNHDYKMLKEGSYPYYLKKRIESGSGHLSNEQTASLLQEILGYGTTKILLAHLSENNNSPLLALNCASGIANKSGVKVDIFVASQNEISEVI